LSEQIAVSARSAGAAMGCAGGSPPHATNIPAPGRNSSKIKTIIPDIVFGFIISS
jgi:hypothetical protein